MTGQATIRVYNSPVVRSDMATIATPLDHRVSVATGVFPADARFEIRSIQNSSCLFADVGGGGLAKRDHGSP